MSVSFIYISSSNRHTDTMHTLTHSFMCIYATTYGKFMCATDLCVYFAVRSVNCCYYFSSTYSFADIHVCDVMVVNIAYANLSASVCVCVSKKTPLYDRISPL